MSRVRSGSTGRPSRQTPGSRRILAPLLLGAAIVTVLAGCSSGGDDSADSGDTAGTTGVGAPAAEMPEGSGAGGESAADGASAEGGTATDSGVSEVALMADRKQILRADLVVESDTVLTDARLAEAAATAAGGVVTDEQTATDPGAPDDGGARTVSVLTMRVPPDALDALLTQLADLGTLLSQNRGSDDVTDEYVDVAARVESQRASLDRLLSLVTDAADLTDVVTLENEISRRQSDLDALSARLQALDDEVALATVTLTLTSPDDSQPAVASAGFMSGLRDGWDAFTGALVAGLTVLGAVLPFALAAAVIGIPLYVLRSRRRAGPALPATPDAPPA